ncbi:MAG: HAD family hydrolase [Pseudomonadota bacterium]
MWSGPRNLSTAMMYAFGNRGDMTAVDEPFYGAYLAQTGINHPLAQETMAALDCDPESVAQNLALYPTPHQYEKHMVHHMRPGFPLDWMDEVQNVFLLRHPARVLASYLQKREAPTAEDLGFTQMRRLFDRASRGAIPAVIDSEDVLRNPRTALSALCSALCLPFDDAMLSWPTGPKHFDGPWAPHWYGAVHRSTGFASAPGDVPGVPPGYTDMIDVAMADYTWMRQHRV